MGRGSRELLWGRRPRILCALHRRCHHEVLVFISRPQVAVFVTAAHSHIERLAGDHCARQADEVEVEIRFLERRGVSRRHAEEDATCHASHRVLLGNRAKEDAHVVFAAQHGARIDQACARPSHQRFEGAGDGLSKHVLGFVAHLKDAAHSFGRVAHAVLELVVKGDGVVARLAGRDRRGRGGTRHRVIAPARRAPVGGSQHAVRGAELRLFELVLFDISDGLDLETQFRREVSGEVCRSELCNLGRSF